MKSKVGHTLFFFVILFQFLCNSFVRGFFGLYTDGFGLEKFLLLGGIIHLSNKYLSCQTSILYLYLISDLQSVGIPGHILSSLGTWQEGRRG